MHLKIFLVFLLHKVSSSPIGQLTGLDAIDGPSPIENQDDDSESFINVLHVNENVPNEVTIPDDIINDVTNDDLEETNCGTDKPFRIGISVATTPMDELTTTEEINFSTESTTKEDKVDTTTLKVDVEEKTVNIGFKKTTITESPTWKTSTVRNIEVITENIPTTQKLEGRFGNDLNTTSERTPKKLAPTESENNPHGYPQAIFNGVFAIGRSDFAPESSTTPKPGSFGSSFLNLAKKFDARYKYKYSWSFSGVEKTTPKPPEIDGPLFNQKFLAKLTSSNENIKLNATNLSETGILTTKPSDYKGLNLYKPTIGTFL
nr:uncharacterized protein LOC111425473 [Onthophagus taurus]